MKDQRKSEIRVGILILLGIVIILWVFGWAKNITINSQRKIITVEFNSVAGLEISDPVAINGVRKGYVDDIRIEKNKVHVVVNIESEIILKEDAKFQIMMLDLMGGKKVEIDPGSSENELNYQVLHKGKFVGDIASAMAVFGSVETDLVDVIKEVKVTLANLNKTLTDQDFNKDLRSSLYNLTQLTENLNKLIVANKEGISQLLNSGIELSRSVNDFFETNKDSISSTITSLKQTLDHSKEMIIKVNELIDKTNAGQNNLGKFMNDPEIVTDLKSTLNQLKDLTRLLLDQLKKEGIKVDADINLF
jgi:phospholipid/cholesterol/gamma-HCH transport system substrate-binding protein